MAESENQANIPYAREFDDRALAYFLDNPQILGDVLRLKVPKIAARMRFEDAEKVDRTFIPADLQKKTSDLIYKVPYSFRDGKGEEQEVWVYILLENKSERSIMVMFQLFLYIFHILLSIWREWEQAGIPDSKRRFPIIIPLVFYIGQKKWDGPLELSQCFEDIPELSLFIPGTFVSVPEWQTLFLNLNAVSDEELVEANTLASQVFRVIKTEGRPYVEYEATLSSVLNTVAAMPDVTEGNRLEATWLLLLQAYHTLSENQVLEAHQKITESATRSSEKVRERMMRREDSYAAQLERKGKDLGIRESLLILIETRFGQPSEEILERINAVDLDTVTDWIRQIVSVDSLDELGILSRDH